MFYFLIAVASAFLSLALSSRKLPLFEGMVLGMMLRVLRMGSVSILSMRESRF